jgi:hypothetical protein
VTTEQLLDSNGQPRLTVVKDPFGTIVARQTVAFSLLGKPTLIEDGVIEDGKQASTVFRNWAKITATVFQDNVLSRRHEKCIIGTGCHCQKIHNTT